MLIRFLIVALIFTACRTGEIACPKVKGVKLRTRPGNYLQKHSASTAPAVEEKTKPHVSYKVQRKDLKSLQNIEEWDCPRPGGKAEIPKAVKANIKKNRRKFDDYYRSRNATDTVKISSNRSARTSE